MQTNDIVCDELTRTQSGWLWFCFDGNILSLGYASFNRKSTLASSESENESENFL